MPTSSTHIINMEIPAVSDYVGVVRLAVSGVASRLNFTVEDIEDIKIAVSEACTNAVQHAYQENNNGQGRVYITCTIKDNTLEIVVKDNGVGFELAHLGTQEQQDRSHQKMGLGLGITFIKSLMDEAEIHSIRGKGTTVTMSKSVPIVVE